MVAIYIMLHPLQLSTHCTGKDFQNQNLNYFYI